MRKVAQWLWKLSCLWPIQTQSLTGQPTLNMAGVSPNLAGYGPKTKTKCKCERMLCLEGALYILLIRLKGRERGAKLSA